jgi:hypothetical protein
MDEMDDKRNMIQMLLQMLKSSASDEVMGGMKAPEGMPDDAKGLEIDKISVMPHDKAEEAMKDEHMEPSPEAAMADSVLSKGKPDMEDEDEEGDDMPSGPFSSFLKRKK